jgi:hypothetical protein
MQTFLPFESFVKSASVIDNKRLGNQCYRECLTLYNGGWPNHPACKMWIGYERWLAFYAWNLAMEMGRRRRKDGERVWKPEVVKKWCDFWEPLANRCEESPQPPWLGDERLHSSHRAALLAKDSDHYSQYNWKEVPSLDYWWPV